MACFRGAGTVVCVETHHEVLHEGKLWRFQYSPILGPWLIRRDGEPFARMPGEKSKFWPAFAAWQAHPRKAEKEGTPTT